MKRIGDKYRLKGKSSQIFKREDGVRFIPSKNKWIAQVESKNKVVRTIGLYDTEQKAREEYEKQKSK